MNRYYMIRRLRWPLLLLLVGVLALLNQADILHWGRSWPLFLIYFGGMKLAERAALSFDQHQNVSAYEAAAGFPTSSATGHVETMSADETISTHSNDTEHPRGVQL